MSVRKVLEQELREAWADVPELAAFHVIATERQLDAINRPTALLRQTRIARLPQAPASRAVSVNVLLTLISPHADLDRAADQLDDAVPAALEYLRRRYLSAEAEAVGYLKLLAYDIPLTIYAPVIPTDAPEPEPVTPEPEETTE